MKRISIIMSRTSHTAERYISTPYAIQQQNERPIAKKVTMELDVF
jgi:hypothetical protein